MDAIVARIPEIQRALKESVTQDRQDRPSEVLRQDRPSNYHHFSNAVKSLLDERGNDNLLTSVHTKDVQADDTVSYYTPTRVPVLDDDDPNDASARSYDWRSAVTHSTHSGYDQDQLGESCTAAIRYHTGSADYDGSENIALGGSIHGKGVLRRDAGLAVSWKSVDRAHKTLAHPD